MVNTIKVIGGNPLIGTITPVANKNAILPAIACALLTDEDIIYKNVPRSTDVMCMLEMLKKLGATIDDRDFNNLRINCKKVKSYKIDLELGAKIRSSIFFASPLLSRFKKAIIPFPGGCQLGTRSLTTHLNNHKNAGVKIEIKDKYVLLTAPQKAKNNLKIWQLETSVTASETILMYLSTLNVQAEIYDCATDPHVEQTTRLLQKMGAKISGIGSNKITIRGKSKLNGTTFIPEPDFVDIAGLMTAAAVTKGNLRIKNGNQFFMTGIIEWYKRFNVNIVQEGKDLVINQKEDLKLLDINTNFPLAIENLPKFVPRPWPGFPVDCLPALVVLSTKAKGRILIQNWMYETGLGYIELLNKTGSNIYMTDPQKIIVEGPCEYKGGRVKAPDIIQASMAIFLAALTTPAVTIIEDISPIFRRYPNFVETYKRLGAKVEEVK